MDLQWKLCNSSEEGFGLRRHTSKKRKTALEMSSKTRQSQAAYRCLGDNADKRGAEHTSSIRPRRPPRAQSTQIHGNDRRVACAS